MIWSWPSFFMGCVFTLAVLVLWATIAGQTIKRDWWDIR